MKIVRRAAGDSSELWLIEVEGGYRIMNTKYRIIYPVQKSSDFVIRNAFHWPKDTSDLASIVKRNRTVITNTEDEVRQHYVQVGLSVSVTEHALSTQRQNL